jgi:dihydroorotase
MEMPNTVPQTTTQERLAEKFDLAAQKSLTNYSFYIGATNDNINELLKTDFSKTCGVKLFMGSSTGNMLVDRRETLENIFSRVPGLIAVHCEDEEIIRKNTEYFRTKYGEDLSIAFHPAIRNDEACYTVQRCGLRKIWRSHQMQPRHQNRHRPRTATRSPAERNN